MEAIKLTQYSHGAGCGCKIAPAVLEQILSGEVKENFSQLLVGNESKDDAAVYELADGNCIISTTDFFMPIVDDAFTFGQIAAANALSDVYAMGGKPMMALAILGWPVEKIPVDLAKQVIAGGRSICERAGIPLAGGHSIDSPEPIFGLAVTGTVKKSNIKRNNTAKAGDLLYLMKSIGTGIITTAQKRGLARQEDLDEAVRVMTELNVIGEHLGTLDYVHAMTDVTGFGLLGHLIEVCEGSNVSAEIEYPNIPLINNLSHYTSQMIFPDNTMRNWQSYEKKVSGIGAESLLTLCDPQTSGGLLICVERDHQNEFEKFLEEKGVRANCVGQMMNPNERAIIIRP
ncbi:MAG TPA: selenide, water dikinase SelD [Cyclobacteriaceae bacterium]|nr:selenide, water dikinase SelD [Cyclobacteriaceae bacterium]